MDCKSYNEETFKTGVLGKEALIQKEEKTSIQVKIETYGVMEAQIKIRHSHIALLYRSIYTEFESQAFLVNKHKL